MSEEDDAKRSRDEQMQPGLNEGFSTSATVSPQQTKASATESLGMSSAVELSAEHWTSRVSRSYTLLEHKRSGGWGTGGGGGGGIGCGARLSALC